MADQPGSHIIEVRAGSSQQQVLELKPGTPVQPMSVGRSGTWPLDAPDVLDVHAYLYFDGRALFVQSANASNPAKGNGQAIATQWQQIEIPCTLELGKARLVYRMLNEPDGDGDEDKTIAQAVKIPASASAPNPAFRPNAGMFSNRDKAPDSDSTRFQPMNVVPGGPGREPDPTVVSPLETGTPMGGVPMARPAAGMPAGSRMPGAMGAPAPPPPMGYQGFGSVQVAANAMGQTLQAPMNSPLSPQQMGMMPPMQGMPPQQMGQPMGQPMGMNNGPRMMPMMQGMPGTQPPGMMQAPPGMPGQETGRIQTPPTGALDKAIAEWKEMPPIRKIILGTFPGVAILAYMMLFTDNPRQMQQQPNPQGSNSAAMTATAPVTNTAPTVTTPPPPTTAFTAQPPPPTASTAVIPVPTASASASATATAAPVHPPKPDQRTLERQAIDLAMQGQYAKAADLYDQLAVQHPEQPAFKEAARLLRLRVNPG